MKNESEILIYQNPDGAIRLDVRLEDETVWLTQAHLCELFGKSKKTISEHIRNIFAEGELDEKVVVRKFRTTTRHGAMEGKTQSKEVNYYNLDVIISVGYRVKSHQGTQFRIWATQRLKEYIVKGFALNDERFKTGQSMNYFSELQERIREIRLSERFFYQKIKDIYATSIDYNPQDEQTLLFFKTVQNKLLWAISEQTAAELVYRRSDAALPLMGMQSFDKKAPVAVRKSDVSVAKNYLNEDEMKLLGLLVEQYLAFAEVMAQQQTPMYMKNWIERLDSIIQRNYLKETVVKHSDRAEAERFWNFPYAAVEEALVNAVYHRSYEIREPVEVRITLQDLVILSFPGPDRSIRMDDLRAGRAVSRRYRNRRIGEFLKELDLTEGRSTGIPKILREMAANGSPAPEFDSDDDRTYYLVRLPIHPRAKTTDQASDHVAGEVKGKAAGTKQGLSRDQVARDKTQQVPSKYPASTQQVKMLLAATRTAMSRAELMDALSLKDRVNFSQKYLEPALSIGLIEMTEPDSPRSPTQKYFLTEKGKRMLENS